MSYPIQVRTRSGTVITINSDTEYTRQSAETGQEKAHTCLFWGAGTHRGVVLRKVMGHHPLVFAAAVPDEQYGGQLVHTFRSTPVVEINGVMVPPEPDGGDNPDEGGDEEEESEAQSDGTGEPD